METTNFTDTITYVVRRKHNFSFGFGYRRMQNNALSYANSRGSFSFSGLLTSQFKTLEPPDPRENPVTVSIDASVETIVDDIIRQLKLEHS